MAQLAEIWAKNLEKRVIAANTKEEKLAILIEAGNAPTDCVKIAKILVEDNSSRAMVTDYQTIEQALKDKVQIVTKLAVKHGLRQLYENYIFSKGTQDLGSSPERKSLEYLYCANNDFNFQINTCCLKRGSLRCCGCFLVAYCSKICQTEHWQKHKEDCKSELVSPNWRPTWISELRLPTFVTGDRIPEHIFKEHIWGNTPAFDLMRWEFNETKNLGESAVYDKPISMAFIGSGDFRNLIETVASVPGNVSSPLHIVINDKNPIVVARNLTMLLSLQTHGVEAIDAVLQAWYSTTLPEKQYQFLCNYTHSKLLKDVLPSSDKPRVFLNDQRKNYSIHLYQAKVILKILYRMHYENSSDVQAVSDKRMKVLFDPRHTDRRDSYMLRLKPHQRVAWRDFRRFGLFLPFSASNDHFNVPNRFIMNPDSAEWPMTDSSDPFDAWDMRCVNKFAKTNRLPNNDIIGSLYFYVRDRLLKALATLERLPVQIDIYCNDASDLAKTLSSRVGVKFDRIETSNLADENYVGFSKLLSEWAPLLNEKNANSVLITLFMNWFGRNYADLSKEELFELSKYCDFEKLRQGATECANGNRGALRALQDESKEFDKFLTKKMQNLKKFKVVPREQHKIVPHRLFAPIEAPKNVTFRELSDEENYFVSSGITKCTLRERYVEWVLK